MAGQSPPLYGDSVPIYTQDIFRADGLFLTWFNMAVEMTSLAFQALSWSSLPALVGVFVAVGAPVRRSVPHIQLVKINSQLLHAANICSFCEQNSNLNCFHVFACDL